MNIYKRIFSKLVGKSSRMTGLAEAPFFNGSGQPAGEQALPLFKRVAGHPG